jgi:hypothetical protein
MPEPLARGSGHQNQQQPGRKPRLQRGRRMMPVIGLLLIKTKDIIFAVFFALSIYIESSKA